MPSRIVVDPNTYVIEVHHDLKTPVFPTDETMEISQVSEQVRIQLTEFLVTKHEPLVKKLLEMIDKYNVANDPRIAALRSQELEQKREPVKVVEKKGFSLWKDKKSPKK